MKIQYEAHACLRCSAATGESLLMDPPAARYGYILQNPRADYVTTSHGHEDHSAVGVLMGAIQIPQVGAHNQAGPFAVDCMTSFHDDRQGALRGENRVYRVRAGGVTLVHLGDLGHLPGEELTAFAAGADVLAVPVGGVFTIGPEQAVEVISLLKPKFVLPMHYRTSQCSLQQLQPLEDFLKLWQGPTLTLEGSVFCPQELGPCQEPVVLLTDFASRKENED